MIELGRIAELWRYPVCSLGGERLDVASLDEHGILGDRTWVLADPATGAVASPDQEKRWRGAPNIRARKTRTTPEIEIGDGVWLSVEIEEAAAAASAFLGFPVVFKPVRVKAPAPGEAGARPRYERADLHLLTTASLSTLQAVLPPGVKADPRRFRPNLVLRTEDASPGFIEQSWIGRTLEAGPARLTVSEPCGRCSFTALAQRDLGFAPQVLHAITRYGAGDFGVYAGVDHPGELRIGAALYLRG